MLGIAEGVLDPSGDSVDQVHGEHGDEDDEDADLPVVDEDGGAVSVVAEHAGEHTAAILGVALGLEVEEGREAEDSPEIAGHVPEEIEAAGAVEGHGVARVVEAGVFPVVEADVRGAAELGNVAVEVAEEELQVAAEELVEGGREKAAGAVSFQVAGAEHADEALELDAVEGEVEGCDEEEPGFAEDELRDEERHDGEGEGDHEA